MYWNCAASLHFKRHVVVRDNEKKLIQNVNSLQYAVLRNLCMKIDALLLNIWYIMDTVLFSR